MKVPLAVLADAAVANPIDGKLSIIGGGFDTIQCQQFPTKHPQIALALRVQFSSSETGRPHKLEVQAVDADGHQFQPPFAVDVTPPKNGTEPANVQLVGNFQQLVFEKPAEYAFNVLVDGSEVASVPLRVVQMPSGGPGLRAA